MVLIQAFEEKQVHQLLTAGPIAELEEAFTQIDSHLRNRFVKAVRNRIEGLSSDDLADAWQEALRDLLCTVRLGRYTSECKIVPWLWRIFIRRAVDQSRRNERTVKVLEGLRSRLDGTRIGDHVDRIDQEDRQHLLRQIRRVIQLLPERQRAVVETFVDHFPTSEDIEELRRKVSERTQLPHTRIGVARALEAARRRVVAVLTAFDS